MTSPDKVRERGGLSRPLLNKHASLATEHCESLSTGSTLQASHQGDVAFDNRQFHSSQNEASQKTRSTKIDRVYSEP